MSYFIGVRYKKCLPQIDALPFAIQKTKWRRNWNEFASQTIFHKWSLKSELLSLREIYLKYCFTNCRSSLFFLFLRGLAVNTGSILFPEMCINPTTSICSWVNIAPPPPVTFPTHGPSSVYYKQAMRTSVCFCYSGSRSERSSGAINRDLSSVKRPLRIDWTDQ